MIGERHVVNREELRLDAARLREYYRQKGYLEAEVDRRITLSDDQRDAVVTFVVEEGERWTVGQIEVRAFGDEELVFPAEQIELVMALRPGEIYAERKLRESARAITDLYGTLGYLDTRLLRRNTNDRSATGIDRLFDFETNTVDLSVTILQGTPTTVGKVTVRGNGVTRTKVILRELRGITPGRRFDRAGFEQTQRRLNETPLFANANITVLGEVGDADRDVLVDVTERNTGSISFGATISSDAGLLGAIDVTQRNFDITDLPESWDDFLSNRAFRGGGQTFNLTLQPGNENSRYAVGLSDPFFLDSDFFLDTNLFFDDSDRDEFDERRSGGRLGLGKRFGDVWSASVRARIENIRIADIEDEAALDVFAVEGTNLLTSTSLRLTRSTTDSNFAPPAAAERPSQLSGPARSAASITTAKRRRRWTNSGPSAATSWTASPCCGCGWTAGIFSKRKRRRCSSGSTPAATRRCAASGPAASGPAASGPTRWNSATTGWAAITCCWRVCSTSSP